jgi:hypothetical protein
MISNKRGDIGEGVMMIVRIFVVALIAIVIFGIVAVFYSHDISIRDSEAAIMGKNIVDCLAPKGVFYFDSYPKDEVDSLLSYCGFDGNLDRVFARVIVSIGSSERARFYQGDSGALWIRALYAEGTVELADDIKQYEPGYFKKSYPIYPGANMEVEVLIQNEK